LSILKHHAQRCMLLFAADRSGGTARERSRPSAASLIFRLLRQEDGTSAIEFALLGQVLIIGLLTAVDLGFAAHDRMVLDTIIRSGAQSAMNDPGQDSVLKVLRTVASTHYTVADPTAPAADKEAVTLTVERSCSCPANPSVPVASCTTLCASSERPSLFYRLSATKSRSTIIVPRMSLAASLKVQAR
jgi:Flp pilus assembly protein TadG